MHEHLEQKLGVHPDEIDAIVFTHLHWDHVQNMKKFRNARYIAPKAEIEMAYNPLPLYYRTYECGILGIDQAYEGCVFEAVADECEVLSLAVAPERRGAGVGGFLFDAAIDRAASAGAAKLFLEVAEDNEVARNLYTSRGLVPVGRRPDYYHRKDGSKAAAVTMSCRLEPEAVRTPA